MKVNVLIFAADIGNFRCQIRNQLPASLLASFPWKLNTFRKWVKNEVTNKGIQVGVDCKYAKCCEV
jgi:hypothetical protein